MTKHEPNDVSIEEVRGVHDVYTDKAFQGSDTVPEKYKGTSADKNDMSVLGRKQVLRRNFRFTTMLGFASTVLVAWEILPVISVYALENGGTAIIFWSLVSPLLESFRESLS